MANAYFIVTQLINGVKLGEITPDETVEVLEKVLLLLDGIDLTADEQVAIAKILRGDN